jgi:hypothetical protein
MAELKLTDRLLTVKPHLLMSLGLVSLIAVGLMGKYFGWSRLPLMPVSNITVGVVCKKGV